MPSDEGKRKRVRRVVALSEEDAGKRIESILRQVDDPDELEKVNRQLARWLKEAKSRGELGDYSVHYAVGHTS